MSARAQARLDPNPQARVGQAAPEQVAIDIARIRRLLGEPQPPGSGGGLRGLASAPPVQFVPHAFTVDSNGTPRYEETVYVFAFKWDPPTFAEQLKALEKESRFPYSYAPSLQELTARIPGLQYLHPVNAVLAANKAIRGAVYRRKVEKARREVEAELRALKAHNAALAAAESKPPQEPH